MCGRVPGDVGRRRFGASLGGQGERAEGGRILARESARMHHDMAGELAAGRAQVELEDGVPQLGAAHVGDYFDDDSAAVAVVGAL